MGWAIEHLDKIITPGPERLAKEAQEKRPAPVKAKSVEPGPAERVRFLGGIM